MTHLRCRACIAAAGLLFAAGPAWPQASAPGAPLPAALAAPAGERLLLEVQAAGTQVYRCAPAKDAPERLQWTLVAPDADLFDGAGHKVGRHYAGPTWELDDGSKVLGEVVARDAGPDAAAIPWLLLRVKESSPSGRLAQARSVQRLATQGGKAPAGACTPGQDAAPLRVPYKAVYRFLGG